MWDKVDVLPVPEGYALAIAQKVLQSWGATPLVVPYKPLAEAMREEWRRQPKKIDKQDMPLTGMTLFVFEQVLEQREARIGELMAFLETDALCYRIEEPAELAARQCAAWDPWLQWAKQQWQVQPASTTSILPVTQPDALLKAAERWVREQPDFKLAALHQFITTLGSFILGAAVLEKAITPQQAYETAFLEEHFQREQWGEDSLATERLQGIERSLQQIAVFADLLHSHNDEKIK